MTEQTTEEQIAKLAKDRAKTILENGDFWSSPNAANTSAQAIGTLLSYRWQLEPPPPALAIAEAPQIAASGASGNKLPKAKEQAAATTEANAEPEPADA